MKSTTSKPATPGTKLLLKIVYILPVFCVLILGAYLVRVKLIHPPAPVRHLSTKPFAVVNIGALTARLFTQNDQLQPAGNDLFIEFRDGQSNLVNAGAVTFELQMSMPDMVMHSIGKVLPTSTSGQYRTTVNPQMAGAWNARLGISGPAGELHTNFPALVK